MSLDHQEHPHRRYNPLSDEWVVVSPHRTKRPWQGQQEKAAPDSRPAYDPSCYLCPGNTRANGEVNPDYATTYVFPNDFPALLPETPAQAQNRGLLRAEPAAGECRVICFSPRHDLTLAQMEPSEVVPVVDLWASQTQELGQRWEWVQVFENKGAAMGCSNPHPHGQIWTCSWLPMLPAREHACQSQYWAEHGRALLTDVVERELDEGERVVEVNDAWVSLVPFWATWPFELIVVPRRPVRRMPELTSDERRALAELLVRTLARYDNLFETSFPYSMGWHGAPFGQDGDGWVLHAHAYPPLLRSATVRKFMVGFEMLAEPQRDISPEQSAARLRECSPVHYSRR